MKTKALLLTVALGVAGAATSMAQVYSQNAVGYINLTLPAGFSIIANQLSAPSYTLNALIPNPPPSTIIYKFIGTGYQIRTFDPDDLVWSPNGTDVSLGLGEGAFISLPTPTTLTFVGEVPQGTLNTPVAHGFSIISSQVPQSADVTALGLVGGPSDIVYKFVGTGYQIFTFDPDDLVWSPGVPQGPTMNVGEGFFYSRSGASTTWTRTFSVN